MSENEKDFVAQEVSEVVGKVATVGGEFLKTLVGKTVDEAKKLVQDSGLKVREIPKGHMTDMEFIEDRVNLEVSNGIVDEARAG